MRRAVAVALVTAFALLGLAQPAFAHNTLTSSDPEDGSSIDAGPSRVTLTFNDDVQPGEGNQIAVVGPGNTLWTKDGGVEVDGRTASIPLAPLGPAGEYTLNYRILSADGHVVRDQLKFTLTKAGDGRPVGKLAETEDGGDGVPLWVWIAGAGVLLAAGLVLALRMGKEPE